MASNLVAQYLNYAKPYAQKYNLDPYAMLAVANAESGLNPGAIGDNGQSFGYHQFYTHGAGGPNARQYLDPRKNIERAAQLMSQAGAAGLSGKAAIDAMVRRFERPANPGGEVQRAMDFYNSVSKGKGGGVTGPMPWDNPPPPMNQMQQQGGQAPQVNTDPLAQSRSTLMQLLMSQNGQQVDPQEESNNLMSLLQGQQEAMSANSVAPMGSQPGMPQMPQAASTAPFGPSGKFNGAYPLGKRGKLIGTPYSGTHTLGNWQSDNAVDLGTPVGTPIVAVADGTIGSRFGSLGKGGRFAGLRMTVESKNNAFYYAHLSRFAAGIKPGARVRKGQVIGYSGEANGVAHLHFGVEHGNPLDLFHLR